MKRRPHLLIVVTALVAFVLGVWGYLIVVPASGGVWGESKYSLSDAIYRALQLFIMNRDDPPGAPWQVKVARILAPISALGGLSLLLDRIQFQLRLYLAKRRSHVIVCGLGRKGVVNVHAMRQGGAVVAVERQEDHAAARSLDGLGVPVVRGDAKEKEVLVAAGVETATELIVACGDDDTDVRIVRQAVACIEEHEKRIGAEVVPSDQRRVLKLVPHLDDLEPRGLLRRHIGKVNERLKATRLILVDYCHQNRAARSLFEAHPLDRRPITASSSDVPHLVLLGFGKMGEAIFLQAIQLAHYPNGATLRVDVFDRRIDELWKNFCGRFPNFIDPTIDPPAHVRLHSGDLLDAKHFERIAEIASTSHTQSMIVIAFDNETEAARVVSHLPDVVAEQSVPVCVRIEEEGGLADMMHESSLTVAAGADKASVSVFGHVEATVDFDDARETLAMALHAKYLDMRDRSAASPLKASEVAWDQLEEEFRESNRRAIDFMPVLLRSLGYRIATTAEAEREGLERITALSGADELGAAVAEHGRWYSERYLAGWQPTRSEAVGGGRPENASVRRRKSAYMVPWSKLSPAEQQRAGWPVNQVLATLSTLGRCIVRDDRPSSKS